jgi:hypothetical protein
VSSLRRARWEVVLALVVMALQLRAEHMCFSDDLHLSFEARFDHSFRSSVGLPTDGVFCSFNTLAYAAKTFQN